MGRVMANTEFRCRLRYQLLIPMFPVGAPCTHCGQGMDRWADQCRVGRGVANSIVTMRFGTCCFGSGRSWRRWLPGNLHSRFGWPGSRRIGRT
eukprot:jgi/Botrbrau1/18262/Bobra.0562s0004.1